MTQLHFIGSTLGHFEISAELGRGGMGVVYKARQTDLDRVVALKVLPPELTYDPQALARFHQEARNAASLEHPHIVPIYEFGAAEAQMTSQTPAPSHMQESALESPYLAAPETLPLGVQERVPGSLDGSTGARFLPRLHYIAMKYIQGGTLKDLLEQKGALPIDQAIEILMQVAEALDYAHEHGVIHRDLKPSNIMIADAGWVYLTDFGLARGMHTTRGLTASGLVMGTPEYMSPEQAQGVSQIGPATDIYALGVVLYEMLSGKLPFEAETPMGMVAARLLEAPKPLHISWPDAHPAAEQVVMRALEKQPEQRFKRAGELVDALRQSAESPKNIHTNRDQTLITHSPFLTQPRPAPASAAPEPAVTSIAYRQSSLANRFTKHIYGGTAFLLVLLLAGVAMIVPVFRTEHQLRPTPAGVTSEPVVINTPLPQLESLLDRGWDAFYAEQYDEAAGFFRAASHIASDQPDALTGLAWTLRMQGEFDTSISTFQHSLALDDTQSSAHDGLGWNLYELDRYDAAERHFRRAIEQNPDYASAWYGLGATLDERGRLEQAEAAYTQALEIDPDYEEVQDDLQRLYARFP